MATLIKSDGTEEAVEFRKGSLKLEQWQKLVGGYVQHVRLGNGKILLCDEDGKMKQKPINLKASELWTDTVVGDVLVCTYKEFQAK